MCDIDDLEPCSVWRETPRTARKARECDGCGAEIRPGEPYLDHFHVHDGNPGREACCYSCWLARRQFSEEHGAGRTPSGLIDELRECIGANDDPEDIWRPVLASVLARYRVSPRGRRALRWRWLSRVERRLERSTCWRWIQDPGRAPPSVRGGT